MQAGKADNLQVKSLKGQDEMYRVRLGRLRIIYRTVGNGKIVLLAVRRRDEKTYRDV
ncbi:MAG: type II toxin-antitoxin system RelE/ParE family toxin [Candidatus Pacebacteria bacterium]|nr:type II toxin-antitoxin system RelE/ParE family toxin [Candidatus Paceibacterota bacterium]